MKDITDIIKKNKDILILIWLIFLSAILVYHGYSHHKKWELDNLKQGDHIRKIKDLQKRLYVLERERLTE